MIDVHRDDAAGEGAAYRWVVPGIYALLIGANLYVAFDWWRDTEGGRSVIDRAKAWAAGCEGCAKRKAWLAAQTDKMHRQAREIVEGDGAAAGSAEAEPESPAP